MLTLILSSSLGRAVAGAALSIALLGGCFGFGYVRGDEARAAQEAAAAANWQLKQTQAATAARAADAAAAAASQNDLAGQLQDAKDALAKATSSPCFDQKGSDALRGLWGNKNAKSH